MDLIVGYGVFKGYFLVLLLAAAEDGRACPPLPGGALLAVYSAAGFDAQ